MNHYCNICKKDYASYQSLWIHKNKFHSDKIAEEKKNNKVYKCNKCDKIYNIRQSKYMHQRKCNGTKIIKEDDELLKLKDQINKLSTELNEIKTNIVPNNTTNNTMTNSHNNTTNNTINNNNTYNIIINKYGSENLFELTEHEALDLLENNINNILYYLEFVNFNKKRPQNHSFCVTALNDRHISVIDNNTNKINKSSKKFAFDNLLIYGIKNITKLYNSNKSKIPYKKRQIIEENIEKLKMYQDMPYKEYLKRQLINSFNMLAYNRRDMVLKTWDNREIIEDEDSDCEDLFINQKEESDSSYNGGEDFQKKELKLIKDAVKKSTKKYSDSDSSDSDSNLKPTKKYSDSDSSSSVKKVRPKKKYNSSSSENELVV